jgi:hypothetical protein
MLTGKRKNGFEEKSEQLRSREATNIGGDGGSKKLLHANPEKNNKLNPIVGTSFSSINQNGIIL